MALQIKTHAAPLVASDDGVVRVRGSRVTLDTIVGSFHRGATAEEIVQQYSSLSLADVYDVIAYYLRNQDDVDSYLRQREVERGQIRAEIESRYPPDGIRERLLARRVKKISGPDATSGGR